MALITCPECKKEISDTIGNCIYCGYKLTPCPVIMIMQDLNKDKAELSKNMPEIGDVSFSSTNSIGFFSRKSLLIYAIICLPVIAFTIWGISGKIDSDFSLILIITAIVVSVSLLFIPSKKKNITIKTTPVMRKGWQLRDKIMVSFLAIVMAFGIPLACRDYYKKYSAVSNKPLPQAAPPAPSSSADNRYSSSVIPGVAGNPTQFNTIREMFEWFHDYSTKDEEAPQAFGKFKILEESPLHIQLSPLVSISNRSLPLTKTLQRSIEEDVRAALIYGIYRSFVHTSINQITVTVIPLEFNVETDKTIRYLSEYEKTISISRAEALDVTKKYLKINSFSDLVNDMKLGDEIDHNQWTNDFENLNNFPIITELSHGSITATPAPKREESIFTKLRKLEAAKNRQL